MKEKAPAFGRDLVIYMVGLGLLFGLAFYLNAYFPA